MALPRFCGPQVRFAWPCRGFEVHKCVFVRPCRGSEAGREARERASREACGVARRLPRIFHVVIEVEDKVEGDKSKVKLVPVL